MLTRDAEHDVAHGHRRRRCLLEVGHDALEVGGVVEVAHDGGELVAAHPRHDRVVGEGLPHPVTDLAQHVVGLEVADLVVDLLEPVDVCEEHAHRLAHARLDGVVEQLAEVAVVPQAGEVVGDGLPLQPRLAARGVVRRGGHRDQRDEHLLVAVGERRVGHRAAGDEEPSAEQDEGEVGRWRREPLDRDLAQHRGAAPVEQARLDLVRGPGHRDGGLGEDVDEVAGVGHPRPGLVGLRPQLAVAAGRGHATSTRTGAWSDAPFPARSSRSIEAPVTRAASGGEASTKSMRIPRFRSNRCR